MSVALLLCNAGSTTLKWQFCAADAAPDADYSQASGSPHDMLTAFDEALAREQPPQAVLHRIVHAGDVQERAQRVDDALRKTIAHWSVLAPLHNPLALAVEARVRERWPHLPQYAVFDSGLFASLPEAARHYALPASLSPRWPIRRYGFHGLAHRYQWRRLMAHAHTTGTPLPSRLITLQLGGGCSLAAWQGDRVIDTSMGFTPLEGLVMATRPGSLDPGIVLHLMTQEHMDVAAVQALLTERAGLASLPGSDGDMRHLLASHTPEAARLVEQYCLAIRRHIGAAIAVLGGLDAISMGGGVGEHQPEIRARVLGELAVFGATLDLQRNAAAAGFCALHAASSSVGLWLTPVNEFDEMRRQYASHRHDTREESA